MRGAGDEEKVGMFRSPLYSSLNHLGLLLFYTCFWLRINCDILCPFCYWYWYIQFVIIFVSSWYWCWYMQFIITVLRILFVLEKIEMRADCNEGRNMVFVSILKKYNSPRYRAQNGWNKEAWNSMTQHICRWSFILLIQHLHAQFTAKATQHHYILWHTTLSILIWVLQATRYNNRNMSSVDRCNTVLNNITVQV
jgi:hypothetical protein